MKPPGQPFRYLKAPFNFNSAQVAQYPVEVTGLHLLRAMADRVGWSGFGGRAVLDFGCGVRFAQTILNLHLHIGRYAGVETNPAPVEWLKENVSDPRFSFTHLNMRNPMYNRAGPIVDETALTSLGLENFDLACMFSVITHQQPADAALIFSMLGRSTKPDGALYFTAFLDKSLETYGEGVPESPCLQSTYNPDYLFSLLAKAGWTPTAVYPGMELHAPIVVARKSA
jgi:SAM-dependent methyltransferase